MAKKPKDVKKEAPTKATGPPGLAAKGKKANKGTPGKVCHPSGKDTCSDVKYRKMPSQLVRVFIGSVLMYVYAWRYDPSLTQKPQGAKGGKPVAIAAFKGKKGANGTPAKSGKGIMQGALKSKKQAVVKAVTAKASAGRQTYIGDVAYYQRNRRVSRVREAFAIRAPLIHAGPHLPAKRGSGVQDPSSLIVEVTTHSLFFSKPQAKLANKRGLAANAQAAAKKLQAKRAQQVVVPTNFRNAQVAQGRKRPQARAVPAQVGRQGRNAGRQQTPVMLPRAPVPKAPMQIHITNNTAKKELIGRLYLPMSRKSAH
eukprot:1176560-Prorocentrum_minimum.AAC.4